MDRAGTLWRHMASNPAGKRELPEKFFHPLLVLRNMRVYLAVCALQVRVCNKCRAPVARPRNVYHVEAVLFDNSVQMHIDEILARRSAPVPHEERLNILLTKCSPHQRIVVQIDLPDSEVIGRTPVRIHLFNLILTQIPLHLLAFVMPGFLTPCHTYF